MAALARRACKRAKVREEEYKTIREAKDSNQKFSYPTPVCARCAEQHVRCPGSEVGDDGEWDLGQMCIRCRNSSAAGAWNVECGFHHPKRKVPRYLLGKLTEGAGRDRFADVERGQRRRSARSLARSGQVGEAHGIATPPVNLSPGFEQSGSRASGIAYPTGTLLLSNNKAPEMYLGNVLDPTLETRGPLRARQYTRKRALSDPSINACYSNHPSMAAPGNDGHPGAEQECQALTFPRGDSEAIRSQRQMTPWQPYEYPYQVPCYGQHAAQNEHTDEPARASSNHEQMRLMKGKSVAVAEMGVLVRKHDAAMHAVNKMREEWAEKFNKMHLAFQQKEAEIERIDSLLRQEPESGH